MSTDGVRVVRVNDINLVFGMDWLPLLGGNLRQQAVVNARKYDASHAVVASEHTAAMGLVRLPQAVRHKGEVYYSAAQAIAILHPSGTVVMLVCLEPELWWLVGVHEGAVVARTDLLFSKPHEATAIMAELQSAYAHARVIDQRIPTHSVQGPEDLARVVDKRALLWRVRHHMSIARYFGLLLSIIALGGVLWSHDDWRDLLGFAKTGPEPLSAAQQWQAWEQSRNALAQGIHVHGVSGMQRLLDSIHQVPVALVGWHLNQVECLPQGIRWRCHAVYRRVSREADNQGLIAQAPASWRLRFPDVNSIEAEWLIDQSTVLLSQSTLDDAHRSDRMWLSSLQQISAAFVTLKAAPAIEVAVSEPIDQQGVAIPKPANFRLYQRRLLQVDGPLRSYSLLLTNLAGVRWKKLTLTVKDLDQPTLLKSRLHLSGQGERYEWQI